MSLSPDARSGWLVPIAAIVVVCGIASNSIRARPAQDTTLTAVLRRAAAYVETYKRELGSVIAEEHYRQSVDGESDRQLISDLLMFSTPEFDQPWIAFRDAREVDGTPVSDQQERLEQMLRDTPEVNATLWQQLVAESARFNIGDVFRNVNVPTMALQLLSWADQSRVSFEKGREREIDGVTVWAVEFREEEGPVLIRGDRGRDLFSRGTAWIEPGTGRVLRTELRAVDARIDLRTRIVVEYAPDPQLGLWVPSKMTEQYTHMRNVTRRGQRGFLYTSRAPYEIRCEATYSNYRRFEVDVAFTVPKAEG